MGVAPEASPVGVIPEASDAARLTLKLGVGDCNVNEVESVLLRLKGVTGVDVESRKGHMVIDYTSGAVSTQKIIDAVARKQGCSTSTVPNIDPAAAAPN